MTPPTVAPPCVIFGPIHRSLSLCNAEVYAVAAGVAASQGAELLVLPEGYGLVGKPTDTSYYEPLASVIRTAPCDDTQAASVQHALSCAARAHRIAVAANVFVSLPNGTHRIVEIVYDATGATLAVYSKHHLFPAEPPHFAPGPFNPTTFALASGTRYGIIICYEGFYPDLTGDWAQMTALKSDNASAFVWSVGDTVDTLHDQAKKIALKFSVPVIGTEDKEGPNADVAIVLASGADASHNDTVLTGLLPAGYTASPIVRVGTILSVS